jgi:His/Glu/Gln/Arg/opine family amino acid ABC transporter permease subunit
VTAAYVHALPGLLGKGLAATAGISAAAMGIALAGGFAIGLLRVFRNPFLNAAALVYVELLRGIPLLVLMFFVCFGLPQLGLQIEAVPAAVIALGLWGAANGAEIVRGALNSIPAGQSEAGAALGLGTLEIAATIVLPQALRRTVAPFMSLFTAIVESSSLAALIGVKEILETVRVDIENDASLWTPLLLTALLLYFAINYPISLLSQRFERSLS